MTGDFSRDTFDPSKHYSRVLMQQGRVQIDSDWNEQTAIMNHLLQTLARDIFGAHGGMAGEPGFAIALKGKNIKIDKGYYYVDGIRCQNDAECWYQDDPVQVPRQPYYEPPSSEQIGNMSYARLLVYLDVWERIVTYIEDPALPDPALGGVDTAVRGQTVWQVRARPFEAGAMDECDKLLASATGRVKGKLKARLYSGEASTDPCIQSPESRYRGAENQLYRVQLHKGSDQGMSFKWSRENGSVVYPIRALPGDVATLENMGRYEPLQEDDWVEYVDDHFALGDVPGPMFQVVAVDPVAMRVTLKIARSAPVFDFDPDAHPFLRRWDQKTSKRTPLNDDGTVGFKEATTSEDNWLNLEDGLQVQFQAGGEYRAGDYWLIPARVATGKIEWPEENGEPQALEPRGVTHHYAPLAIVATDGTITNCRRCIVVTTKSCQEP